MLTKDFLKLTDEHQITNAISFEENGDELMQLLDMEKKAHWVSREQNEDGSITTTEDDSELPRYQDATFWVNLLWNDPRFLLHLENFIDDNFFDQESLITTGNPVNDDFTGIIQSQGDKFMNYMAKCPKFYRAFVKYAKRAFGTEEWLHILNSVNQPLTIDFCSECFAWAKLYDRDIQGLINSEYKPYQSKRALIRFLYFSNSKPELSDEEYERGYQEAVQQCIADAPCTPGKWNWSFVTTSAWQQILLFWDEYIGFSPYKDMEDFWAKNTNFTDDFWDLYLPYKPELLPHTPFKSMFDFFSKRSEFLDIDVYGNAGDDAFKAACEHSRKDEEEDGEEDKA